jgi:hypothetical protein
MILPVESDPRLEQLATICLALPETTCEQVGQIGQHARFLVRKKTFVYYLDNHHGDGIVGMCCKVAPGMHTRMIAADPARFYLPAYLGANGWVGLRLDGDEIDWDEVAALATDSYRLLAPKRLAERAGD